MNLRNLTYADFVESFELWRDSGLQLSDKHTDQEEFKKIIELNPGTCLAVESGNKIVCTGLGLFSGRRGWIYHFAVSNKYRRKGIGTYMMHGLEKALEKAGARKVRLFISISNMHTLPFYLKLGYNVIGDSLLLGRDLK